MFKPILKLPYHLKNIVLAYSVIFLFSSAVFLFSWIIPLKFHSLHSPWFLIRMICSQCGRCLDDCCRTTKDTKTLQQLHALANSPWELWCSSFIDWSGWYAPKVEDVWMTAAGLQKEHRKMQQLLHALANSPWELWWSERREIYLWGVALVFAQIALPEQDWICPTGLHTNPRRICC